MGTGGEGRGRGVCVEKGDVEEGGTTSFTELNITTKPAKGDAIIFYNCKPNGDPDLQTMHSGDKVLKGTKWSKMA